MIVAEGPNAASRSLVVAPPTGWDPSPAEAAELLKLTNDAPWLRVADLGTLATAAAKAPVERAARPAGERGRAVRIGRVRRPAAVPRRER